jgi:hypothetical protein
MREGGGRYQENALKPPVLHWGYKVYSPKSACIDSYVWHNPGMALEGYKSNNNVVYSSKYHEVWTPKYRRSALLGPIAKRCKGKAGVSSHTLRQEFRPLESRLPMGIGKGIEPILNRGNPLPRLQF